eukprot:gnl/Chilomastix_caulleri/8256.p1 GENE.gnl/Chilomastix_caulleri/8256~~gnl/Chilomastix_caulleri/8256.p1  ORF type:complete len:57 (+),score=8.93 gnl/Chilomastix_caulleri/8256:88-258(+)
MEYLQFPGNGLLQVPNGLSYGDFSFDGDLITSSHTQIGNDCIYRNTKRSAQIIGGM